MLTQLGTGEAIVTVMGEKGAPTPVAWTRLRAPQGLMSPTDATAVEAAVRASVLLPKYGTAIDSESAHEMLTRKMEAAAAVDEAAEKTAAANKAGAEYDRMQREWAKGQPKPRTTSAPTRRAPSRKQDNPLTDFLGSRQGKSIVHAVVRGNFGTLKRR